MSLIIKGLDMPNKGYLTEITDVTIRQFADGKIQIEIPTTSMPYYRLYEAIQIPKGHGDIKDENEIIKRLEEKEKEPLYQHDTDDWWVGIIDAETVANSSPTILEEEK